MTVSSGIEQMLSAGTYVQTKTLKGLFKDKVAEQVFIVYVLVDWFSRC